MAKRGLSMSDAILGVLWHFKESSRERLTEHKYISSLCSDKHGNTLRSAVFRLSRAGLIKKDFNNILTLTEKGQERALASFIEAELVIHHDLIDPKWDGGWRMIFFDIPEAKRKERDYLRRVIKLVGFREFQRSIWVYPYPVPEFLKNLVLRDHLRPHISFVTTSLLDDDSELRKIFKLAIK